MSVVEGVATIDEEWFSINTGFNLSTEIFSRRLLLSSTKNLLPVEMTRSLMVHFGNAVVAFMAVNANVNNFALNYSVEGRYDDGFK